MAPRESVFTALSPSLADVTDAIEKVETLIAAKNFKKKLIYDMLLGFRVLEQALQQKQSDAYGLVTKWLGLFLKIQSSISTQDETMRGHFEKVVPSTVTYMIGCLQCKPKGIISYHYKLLEMINELISNVRPQVLEKLASFETGIIACLWFPIDFVGDFNTQMMALRLLVMLLKCVDETRMESELDSIRCENKTVLKDKLTAAIAVANFHAAKFENTARELLNTYNMHLAQKILVYSFHCKTFKFGDSIEFYKPMNADNFWVDFNYSPRTLSFNGRCLAYNQATYTSCTVSLQIEKLTLNEVNLFVKFRAPAQLIKNTNDFPDISYIETAELILPRDEAKRLLENKFVMEYYNRKAHVPLESNLNASVVHLHNTSLVNNSECNEDNRVTAISSDIAALDCPISSNDNTLINIRNMENKENVPPRKEKRTRSIQSNCNIEQPSSSKHFQKSYDFLIGLSKEVLEKVQSKKSSNEIDDVAKPKNDEKEIVHFNLPNLNKRHTRSCSSKLVNYSTSTSDSTPSPESSKVVSSKEIRKSQRKRFFKTQSSDSEYIPPRKIKQVPRKRSTRNKKPNTSNTATKKIKKVNEVKPMLLSKKTLNPQKSVTTINDPVNDIAANVQNPPNITIDITASGTSNLVPNIYDNLVVSDAEPGQSYRNFTTRRHFNEQQKDGPEIKRSRKSVPRAGRKDMPDAARLKSSSPATRTIKNGTKRMSPDFKDQTPTSRAKVRKMDANTTNDNNVTPHSSATEVAISKNQDIIETTIAQGCVTKKQTDVPHAEKNLSMTTLQQRNINMQEVKVRKGHTVPSVSNENMNDSFDVLREIPTYRSKLKKLGATITKDKNLTLPSLDTEVDINAEHDIIDTTRAQRFKAKKQKDLPQIKKNTSNKIINNYKNLNIIPTQQQQTNTNMLEVAVNKCQAIDDIEECRRAVGFNGISTFNDSDEFSDLPTFPNLMDISNILSTPECESTKNKTNQSTTTNLSNTNLNSPTKRNHNTDLLIKNATTTNILDTHNNLIYYSRSESESDNGESTNVNSPLPQRTTNSPEHVFVTPQMPLERFRKTTKSLTKCHVTTTETSIITQQDRFVHHKQFLVNLAASSNTPLNLSKSCTRSTTKTTTKTVVKENNEINLNSCMRRSVNIRTPTPKAMRQGIV